MDNKQLVDFLTKEFQKIDKRFDNMSESVAEMFDDLNEKLENYRQEFVDFKDGVYDKMDAVYKEVLAFRGEEVMHQAGQIRLQDSVDDHEKRIRKLEKPHSTAHKISK